MKWRKGVSLFWPKGVNLRGFSNQGQHGHIVVFWKQVKKVPEEFDDKGNPKLIPLLRYYKVFNVEQCRDIPKDLIPEFVKVETDSFLECEAIINAMPVCPAIKHKEQKAFYHLVDDYINMPKKKSFKSPESYYSTLFHELVHSTGAEKRLGRKSIIDMAEFGSEPYSMEELIAELGASYLNSFTGILDKQVESSAAYISSWLEKFKSDKRFIIAASGQAQRAVDLILNRQEVESKDEVKESMVS